MISGVAEMDHQVDNEIRGTVLGDGAIWRQHNRISEPIGFQSNPTQ